MVLPTGPEKLPDAMRKMGQFYAELRKMSNSFQKEFKAAVDELPDAQRTVIAMRDYRPAEVTADAKRIAEQQPTLRHAEGGDHRVEAELGRRLRVLGVCVRVCRGRHRRTRHDRVVRGDAFLPQCRNDAVGDLPDRPLRQRVLLEGAVDLDRLLGGRILGELAIEHLAGVALLDIENDIHFIQ